MAEHPHLDPSPFILEGGHVGVLLVHGFTGSTTSMRLVGNYLNERNLTVSAPLLPGHGTAIEDLNKQRWRNWTDHVTTALADLKDRCDTIFVGGLSLGGLLTLYLAAHHTEIAGAITYSPAIKVTDRRAYLLPIIKYLIHQVPKGEDYFTDPKAKTRHWNYKAWPTAASHEWRKFTRVVKQLLHQVTCPLLVIYNAKDCIVPPESAQFVYDRVGSTYKDLVMLHNSGHILTIDSEWETVAEKTYQFIMTHVPDTLKVDPERGAV